MSEQLQISNNKKIGKVLIPFKKVFGQLKNRVNFEMLYIEFVITISDCYIKCETTSTLQLSMLETVYTNLLTVMSVLKALQSLCCMFLYSDFK
jgi:hypothetical protein